MDELGEVCRVCKVILVCLGVFRGILVEVFRSCRSFFGFARVSLVLSMWGFSGVVGICSRF